MEVKNETTLKKKVKEMFRKSPVSLKRLVRNKLTTIIDLDIPQPPSCPTCR